MAEGKTVVEYATDIEGNWEYFVDFVSRSQILAWDGETQGVWGPGQLTLKENGVFVFGGDAPDKGPGDIRISKLLVDLKRQHPERVHIILGNRDLTKMRFTAELQDDEESLNKPWLPPWDPKVQRFDAYLEENKLPKNRLSKLKWLLQCTMGCQDTTFGTRKHELAMLKGSATDEDVLRSYLDSVDASMDDPWMLAFLRLGKIGVILDDVLFVHGGLTDESIGVVPGKEGRIEDVHQWIDELNAWKDRELDQFEASPAFRTNEEGQLTRGGSDLILYGTPVYGNRTVIYHNPFQNGNPVQRSLGVTEFLARGGITRLLTGHQPHGQSPTVVRHPSTGLLVVTADTSRSDNTASKVLNPANNRGRAISIIRIIDDVLEIEGITNNGMAHSCRLHNNPKLDDLPDALVGRQLTNNAWVKTILRDQPEDQPRVVTALGKGFAVFVQVMTEKQACLQLKADYAQGDAFVVKLNELHPQMFAPTISSFEVCPHPEDAPDSPGRQQSLVFDRAAFEKGSSYIFSFNGVLLPPSTEKGQSVVRSINKLIEQKKRVVFVTNDTTMSRVALFNKITNDYGVALMDTEHMADLRKRSSGDGCSEAEMVARCAKESIITSSCICAWLLARRGIRKPFVICYGTGLLEELEVAGITEYFATANRDGSLKREFLEPVSVDAITKVMKQAPDVDAIVVGWDHSLTALTVAVAAQYVRWSEEMGIRMHIFACSMDSGGILGRASEDFEVAKFANRKVRTCGIGTMANCIARSAGTERSPIDVGKPSQIFIEHLRRPPSQGGLGIDFSTSVMIGDSLETDVRIAHQAGMSSLLVLSGQTSVLHLQENIARCGYNPTWVVHSFGDTPEYPTEDRSMYMVDPSVRFAVLDDRKQFRAEQGIPDWRISSMEKTEESQKIIEYITDVEGNWEYMVKFVANSEILYWNGETRGVWGPGELTLRDNGILVFGGDAPDKGTGDIRVVKIFVDLKRRYPDRVHIILGNRDLVKLRFPSEVAIEEPWMPVWDSRAKPYKTFLEEQNLEDNRVGRVKWLLHSSMGCQDTTFNTRKTELACLNGRVSDEDVVKSYLSSVDPHSVDPWMLEFLRLGKIALIIDDTLFVHGGIHEESAGYVPGDPKTYNSVPDWVEAINDWKDQQLRDYEAQPLFSAGEGGKLTRGAHELILYGTGYYGKRTVIYFNPFVDGNPVQRSASVRTWLEDSRINRLVTGHQPHGQSPTVVRHPSTGLLVVTADTSRSNANASKVQNPANNRGEAISVVRIIGDCLFIQGEKNDGRPHGCCLHVDPNKDIMPDALVGRQLTDNSWVKTVMRGSEDMKVTIARGKGFNVEVSDISIQQACLRLKSEYGWGGAFAIQLQDITADKINPAELTVEACLPEEEILSPRKYQRSHSFKQKMFDEAETYLFSYNGVMLDPDTEQGKRIVENVNKMIEKGKRVIFISNDSTLSRKSFFKKITTKFGVQLHQSVEAACKRPSGSKRSLSNYHSSSSVCLSQDSVVTSAFTCAWFLKSAGIKKPFVVGYGNGFIDEFEMEGIEDYFATVEKDGTQKPEFMQPATRENILEIVKKAPDIDAIVVGWDQQLTALTIAVAAQYLRWSIELGKPIPIIACSEDLSSILGKAPEDFEISEFAGRKVRTLGIGSISNAICNTVRPPRQAINVGKPSQLFIEHLRRPVEEGGLEVDFTKAVMIGDNMNTDMELANRTGMKSLLVLSGVTSAEDFDRAVRMNRLMIPDPKAPRSFPTWVVDSFASVET